jgi:sortase A
VRKRHRFAKVVGVIGELFITVGVVLLLFSAYQLWWTNVLASGHTSVAREQAKEYIQSPSAPSAPSAPSGPSAPSSKPLNAAFPKGDAFALMYIPRLKDHVWELPVVQGVDLENLTKGVGHYPETAMPGEVGNFAVAGHRATNGEPFANFDQLQAGDKVYVQTPQAWYTYELKVDRIVEPNAFWVVDPKPLPAGELGSDRIITLTTCNPRWASYQRWAFWGVLTDVRLRKDGPPPELEL